MSVLTKNDAYFNVCLDHALMLAATEHPQGADVGQRADLTLHFWNLT
jgi:hypothetical protein